VGVCFTFNGRVRPASICAAIPGWSETESRGCSGLCQGRTTSAAERPQSLDTDRASATLAPSREWQHEMRQSHRMVKSGNAVTRFYGTATVTTSRPRDLDS